MFTFPLLRNECGGRPVSRVDRAAKSIVTFGTPLVFRRGGEPMIRAARTIAPLVRALMFTSVGCGAVSGATLMIGCEDENAPETWVKKLGDPIQRPAAIKR